jgi:glycosyltransferase involved in cell wall biosynthesis
LEEPVVSVVVAAHDRPDMLRTALASVLNQTLTGFEIILQDDSTYDHCEEIVHDLNDRRIRYTHNRPALGMAANLRSGFRKSRGRHIATLHDDDFYAPNYLETMVPILDANPALSLAFCDHYVVDVAGKVLAEESDRNSDRYGRSRLRAGVVPDPLRAALIDNAVPAMFSVFRSRALDLDDFPDEVSVGYDYWLTYLLVRNGAPIWYHPERLTYYRVHEGSQTASGHDPDVRLRSAVCFQFIDRRLLADGRVSAVWPDIRKRRAGTHANAGFAHLRLRHRAQACAQFAASIKTHLSLRAVAGIVLSALPLCVFRRLDRSSS